MTVEKPTPGNALKALDEVIEAVNNGGSSNALISATPFTTETMANPISDGSMTVMVAPVDNPILAVALEGDAYPRLIINADPTDFEGLAMGDGTVNPVTGEGGYIGYNSGQGLNISSGLGINMNGTDNVTIVGSSGTVRLDNSGLTASSGPDIILSVLNSNSRIGLEATNSGGYIQATTQDHILLGVNEASSLELLGNGNISITADPAGSSVSITADSGNSVVALDGNGIAINSENIGFFGQNPTPRPSGLTANATILDLGLATTIGLPPTCVLELTTPLDVSDGQNHQLHFNTIYNNTQAFEIITDPPPGLGLTIDLLGPNTLTATEPGLWLFEQGLHTSQDNEVLVLFGMAPTQAFITDASAAKWAFNDAIGFWSGTWIATSLRSTSFIVSCPTLPQSSPFNVTRCYVKITRLS